MNDLTIDVPPPDTDGVVMDVCATVERFGAELLKRAQEQAKF